MEKVLQNITKLYLVDVKYVQQKTADPRQKLLIVQMKPDSMLFQVLIDVECFHTRN